MLHLIWRKLFSKDGKTFYLLVFDCIFENILKNIYIMPPSDEFPTSECVLGAFCDSKLYKSNTIGKHVNLLVNLFLKKIKKVWVKLRSMQKVITLRNQYIINFFGLL